ncbi:antitrypsin-like isoform X4 [Chironomus tepperi]|uniref:antitrypsin-like isoform X4 n=1 Tax=Chironomus tepperi TaxID=113505 RepID=UPI00391EE307
MIRHIFLSVCTLTIALTASMASPTNVDQQFAKAANLFATELYQKTIEGKQGNVIISPASIQSAVTLAMFGATEGSQTRSQMLQGLKYPAQYSTNAIADSYKAFNDNVEKTNGLKIANKVYVMEKYSVKPSFQEIATKSFKSEAQTLNFGANTQAAATINGWVEDHTNNKIKNLISPDSLSGDTRMVLVNAIYFKGFWQHQFDKQQTFKAPFFLNEVDSVDVDFMKIKKHFNYGVFEELDATALELPYKDSDITMMIILPNKRDGLANLEKKLGSVDFGDMSNRMYSQEVNVEIPKFKIEFDIQLNEPLKKMGMTKMFGNDAEFNNLLEQSEDLKVSEVVHKAFIEVNEEGAEAAAATGIFIEFHILEDIKFIANQPFFFALFDSQSTHFMGRVTKFESQKFDNQKSESLSIGSQKLETQNFDGQKLENQNFEGQKLENQNFEGQKLENQNFERQKVEIQNRESQNL